MKLLGIEISCIATWPVTGIHKTVRYWNVPVAGISAMPQTHAVFGELAHYGSELFIYCVQFTQHCRVNCLCCIAIDKSCVYTALS